MQCREQVVYARGNLTTSATGLAALIFNPSWGHLDAVNGVGFQYGGLAPFISAVPALSTDQLQTTMVAIPAVGQSVTAGGLNGTGYSRNLRWQVDYWQEGTKLNEGGVAYVDNGASGRSVWGTPSLAVPIMAGATWDQRADLPYAVRAPLSNESHTIRGAPVLPDNLKFADINENVDGTESTGNRQTMPASVHDFADQSWNTTIMFRTAAASQSIGFTIKFWYETFYIPTGVIDPPVPASHTSLANPVLSTAQSNSVMTAYHKQKTGGFAGVATKLIESGASMVGKKLLSAGKDLITGQISNLAGDVLRLAL